MNDKQKIKSLENRIHRLNEIGIALSTESDSNKLFEMILEEAKNITNADGRTLYSKNKDGNLKFEILRHTSRNHLLFGNESIKRIETNTKVTNFVFFLKFLVPSCVIFFSV